MRIQSGITDQYIYFVAVDVTDLKTRETGLSGFTVYRSRNGGAAAAYTTPTINETDTTNMPGVYELLLDEDMTIDSGDDSQEVCLHITHASMAPVTRTFELYRPVVTAGQTLTVTSGGVTLADGVSHGGTLGSSTATLALSRASVVSQSSNTSALTLTGNGTGHGTHSTGGATGDGLRATGGATSGSGANISAGGTQGNGLTVNASGTGHGADFQGGAGATGNGVRMQANSTNGTGLTLLGSGSLHGVSATGGATGTGVRVAGGGTSGAGMLITSTSGNGATITGGTNGDGLAITGAGTGSGVNSTSGAGATGDGIKATAASTNGHGFKGTGTGTGDGMELTAGASGVDLDANITGDITGTLSTVTTLTNLPAITANWLTAAGTAADFTTEIQAGLATAAALDAVDNFIDTEVAAILAAVDTEVAAIKAVTDLLPNAGALTTIQADLDDIQTRLPAALVGGRIDASVGAMAANVMTAAAAAADLTTELQSGLATSAALATVAGYIDTEITTIITTLGTPVGASISVDLAAVKTDTAAILVDTGTTLDGKIDTIDTVVDAILADTGTDGVVISAATQGAIADKLLGRSIAGAADGGRTVTDALRSLRNRQEIAAGTLTVYQEDDTTPAWDAAVATAAGDPLTSMDPT